MTATVEILPGLPATGPYPEQFSPDGRGTHREGFVVRFTPASGAPSWVGNFQPGFSTFSAVADHPDGRSTIVFARGVGYVVDPETRRLRELLPSMYAGSWWLADLALLLLDQQGIAFEAIGPEGRRWVSRRLSWDGFRNLTFVGARLQGESWSPIDEAWAPFELDLLSGEASGGTYPEGWER